MDAELTLAGPSTGKHRILVVLISGAVFAAALVTFTWFRPGVIECRGYLEPDRCIPVYAREGGVLQSVHCQHGRTVSEGALLLTIDDEWIEWNLDRLETEITALNLYLTSQRKSLDLWRKQRDIEEKELYRHWFDAQLLASSASLSRSEVISAEYRYRSYLNAADQEERSIRDGISETKSQLKMAELSAEIWRTRLRRCRLSAPLEGVFISSTLLRPTENSPFGASLEPGQSVEIGQLLGYIIPPGPMRARIEIPQHRVSRCSPGQRVIVSVDARPNWSFAPITGSLQSVIPVAVGGFFSAVVHLEYDEGLFRELARIAGANLSARIDTGSKRWMFSFPNSTRELLTRVWDTWLILATPKKKADPQGTGL